MPILPLPSGSATITESAHAALLARFLRVRSTTENLVAGLTPEDAGLQSMPDASPTKWHLAHTSWFFETFILEKNEPGFAPFHTSFRVLFNSYYNGIGDKHPRPERGLISRPTLAEVMTYRHNVTQRIAALLTSVGPMTDEIVSLVTLGCHHEQQHQELILTDLKHLLSRNPQQPAYRARWPLTPIAPQPMQWADFAPGLVEIGHDGNGFAFDNESPRHQVFIEPFALSTRLVTHGEYATFIADGGYTKPALWLSLGWDWVQQQRISAPLYWQPCGNTWETFTLHGRVEIDEHTPMCHLNYFEADAYARWAGARLPRECEWEFAAASVLVDGNFQENQALHPLALRAHDSAGNGHPNTVLVQMFGDVWEWTQSAYLPYPRFQSLSGAVGEYNGKFMCNQFVLRGGSCVTPRDHIRASYRNFFPVDARWQFSGLRLARDG